MPQAGFALMEMMIVISLSGLFIFAVYETVITGLRVANAADEREEVRQQMANVLERFTRDVSQCRNLDQGDDGQFQCDVDTDGSDSSSGTERNHNYSFAGSTLTFDYSGSSGAQTILRNLTSFDFNYQKSGSTTEFATCDATSSCGGAGTCCRDDARAVIVTATATKDAETVSMTTSVYLQNCKSGC